MATALSPCPKSLHFMAGAVAGMDAAATVREHDRTVVKRGEADLKGPKPKPRDRGTPPPIYYGARGIFESFDRVF